MWENIVNQTENRYAKVQKSFEFQEQPRNLPPQIDFSYGTETAIGEGIGLTGDVLGEIVALPLEFVAPYLPELPERVTKGLQAIQQGVANSNTASFVNNWIQQNPQDWQKIKNYGNMATGGLFGASAKTILNTTALNTPTLVRGGIIGDALDKVPAVQRTLGLQEGGGLPFYSAQIPSMLGEYGTTGVKTLKSLFSPSDTAFEREMNITRTKADEIGSGAEGSNETAELMLGQMGRESPLLSTMSEKTYLERGADVSDTENLTAAVSTTYTRANNPNPIPKKVAQRYAKHIQSQVDSKGTVHIKNPNAEAGAGNAEAAGSSSATAPIAVKSLKGKTRETYLNTINAKNKSQQTTLTPEQTVELLQVSGAVDISTYRKYFAKDFDQPSVAIDTLLRARLKDSLGKKLQEGELKALKAFNRIPVKKGTKQRVATVKDDAGNILSNDNIMDIQSVPKDSFLTLQQTFLSRQKALGGANAFISVDPVKQRMYTGISDKHDIFGVNPIGGKNAMTAIPIVSTDYATGKYGKGAGLADSSTYRGKQQAILKEIKKTEQLTGVKINPQESPTAYNRRAIREMGKVKSSLSDQATVARRAAKTAGFGGLLTARGYDEE